MSQRSITSDQHAVLGGDGLGPNPMEIALAALGACQAQKVAVRISGPEPRERYEELRQAVNDHCPVLDVFTHTVPVTTEMSVR